MQLNPLATFAALREPTEAFYIFKVPGFPFLCFSVSRAIFSFRGIDHSHAAFTLWNVIWSAWNNMDMQMRNRLPSIAPNVYAYIESSDLIILGFEE
jgi:hypothetical protein